VNEAELNLIKRMFRSKRGETRCSVCKRTKYYILPRNVLNTFFDRLADYRMFCGLPADPTVRYDVCFGCLLDELSDVGEEALP